MNSIIKKEKKIATLEDLRLKKKQLKKKSEKKGKKIKKRLKKLSNKTNIQNVYDEILSEFNVQHSLMNMLPIVLKYKNQLMNIKLSKKNKKRVFISIGAISSAVLTYLLLSKKRNSNKNKEKNNVETDNFEEYFENNLFI